MNNQDSLLFSVAAVTNDCTCNDLTQTYVFTGASVSRHESPWDKIQLSAGPRSLASLEENPVSCIFQLPEAVGIPWLVGPPSLSKSALCV